MSETGHLPPSDRGADKALPGPLQVNVVLEGHLSELSLAAQLNRAEQEILAAKVRPVLVVNCLSMTGYDSAARSQFVSWNSRQKTHLLCVAVITQNKLWHMVVSSMSLATGQKMSAFNTPADALPWITEQWSRGHLSG